MADALARFTSRRRTTLAAVDASVRDGLSPHACAAAAIVWQRRHANEQASVALAERMVEASSAAGRDDVVVRALARLADDEQAHVDAAANVLDAFDAPHAAAQAIRVPDADEPPAFSLARDIVVGLAICESVSAARFAVVRKVTDVPALRALVDGFLRDEVAHAKLGFLLLREARALATDAWLVREAMTALRELEVVVGMDGARRGLEPPRPQPTGNPGVVEPNLDALAFFRAVEQRVLPRFAHAGLDLAAAWQSRWA